MDPCSTMLLLVFLWGVGVGAGFAIIVTVLNFCAAAYSQIMEKWRHHKHVKRMEDFERDPSAFLNRKKCRL